MAVWVLVAYAFRGALVALALAITVLMVAVGYRDGHPLLFMVGVPATAALLVAIGVMLETTGEAAEAHAREHHGGE